MSSSNLHRVALAGNGRAHDGGRVAPEGTRDEPFHVPGPTRLAFSLSECDASGAERIACPWRGPGIEAEYSESSPALNGLPTCERSDVPIPPTPGLEASPQRIR